MNIILFISIFLLFASLIYICLEYYGIIRLITLKYKPIRKIGEEYLTLDRVSSDSKVVVAIYTENNDMTDNLTLKSILAQTVHPDQIIIISNNTVTIDDFIKSNNIAVVQSTSYFGKVSLFMVPLSSQKDANTKIILVSDNVVYGKDFIETITSESEKYPDKVICVSNKISIASGILVKPIFFNVVHDNYTIQELIDANNVSVEKMTYSDVIRISH